VPASPANNGYQPGFTAALMLKDLKLAKAAADSVGAKTALGAQAAEIYQDFTERGQGAMDFSAIINFLRAPAE
jgi:3-hydroxyisobutyrate dehydrogenase